MNPDLILNNVMIGQLLFVSNLLNSMFVKYTTITGNFTAMFERSLLFFFFLHQTLSTIHATTFPVPKK